MIVVSNTSPLTNLAAIGQFHLLEAVYERLSIPQAVWAELNANSVEWPGSALTNRAGWIEIRPVENQALVKTLQRDLDRGEAESIALALEMKADLLLLDEKEGRRAAERLGLRVTGVIGLLIEAKMCSQIEQVRPLLDALRYQAGFYMSERVYILALDLAGEISATVSSPPPPTDAPAR